MPKQKRTATNYAGVYFVEGAAIGSNKIEKIYYIRYRREGKIIEEKAGRQFQDDMTPARAAGIRSSRIEGKQETNTEKRQAEAAVKQVEQNKWTVARLWERYKENCTDQSKALQVDGSRFDKYLKDSIGDKEPKDLLPLDVDRIRVKLLKTKAPQTVKHVLGILKRVCNFGFNKMLCPALPFRIEMPDVDNKKTEDLSQDELHRLLDAIAEDDNKQIGNMMLMALYTGMRRGELFKLKWDDVDFARGFILIRDPKGGKSQSIPVNDAARLLLESHERTDSEYVFPGENGGQRVSARKATQRIRERAGLPKDFRPLHGLRHTYASMLASSGKVDLYTLQKLMTHKTPAMTQRYAHLRDAALRQAADLAGDIISDAMNRDRQKKVSIARKAKA